MKGSIFTAVLGMSSGLTVQQWSAKGVETVCQLDIPWAIEWVSSKKMIYWPSQWLESVVKMVNFYAKEGDTIAWAMPGADLALIERHQVSIEKWFYRLASPILNYQSLADGVIFEEINKMVNNPKKAYKQIGGANWAFFQPFCHISYYLKKLQSDKEVKVITLADWITYITLGDNGEILEEDPTMLQSQGLYDFEAKKLYIKLFDEDVSKRISPLGIFLELDTYYNRDGVKIIPCTHDSVFARKIGFSVCPSGIWTGTWVGTSDWIGDKNIQPSGKTFDAGIAFEGLGSSRALIANIAMAGAVCKAIVKKLGWSYEQAARNAKNWVSNFGEHEAFDISKLPVDSEKAAQWILSSMGSGELALAYLLLSLAKACREKKEAVYKILRRKVPEEVAVFGGFAENEAFLQALKKFGFEPIVPKFASNATHAGLAMDALTRTGQATNDQEALSMLR